MLTRKLGEITKVLLSLVIVSAMVFGGFKLYRANADDKAAEETPAAAEEHDMVLDDNGPLGYTAADFGQVIFGKAEELSKYVVYNRVLVQKETLTDTAVLNIRYLTKKQAIRFYGDSAWSVDLSRLKESDIGVDNERKTVSLLIPLPEVQIRLNSAKTKHGKIEKGSPLAIGDIKITPENYKSLETRALKDMYAAVYASGESEKAQAAAVKAMEELFNPLIGSVAKGYTVSISFKAPSNG